MTPVGDRIRVVIADDVASLRGLVRLALELDGHFTVVGEAKDGVEAVETVREHLPDIVLLDLSMPHMDGLEAIPLLREASPTSKIVIFSGFREARLTPIALALGAVRYIEKGASPSALAAILRETAATPDLADLPSRTDPV